MAIFMGLSALMALFGTRLAALPLSAAAIMAAREAPWGLPAGADEGLVSVAVWAPLLAAGWLLLVPVAPRRLALPVLGATAALGAGVVPNATAVLGLWVLATATAVVSSVTPGGWTPSVRRWVLGVVASDLLLVAAVVTAAVSEGFEGWPMTLGRAGSILLLGSLAVRILLTGGPGEGTSEGGLLAVRTQAAVGMLLLGVGAPELVLRLSIVIFALGMAGGGVVRSRPRSDGGQELALLGLVVATAALGWDVQGWVWGVLAGGTLTHYLRFIAGRDQAGRLAAGVAYGGGLGLPLLPAIVALLHGAVSAGDAYGALVLASLGVGLAGRARKAGTFPLRRSVGRSSLARSTATLVVALGVGVWAPVLARPEWVSLEVVAWPQAMAVGAVAVGGLLGSQVRTLIPSGDQSGEPLALPAFSWGTRLVDRVASPAILVPALAVLAFLAAGIWGLGLLRGFL